MSRPGEVQLDDADYLAGFANLARRLDRHLHDIDAGHLDATDDIATLLRILVTDGRGEKSMRNLCRRFKVSVPRQLVGPNVETDAGVQFAMGSLPMVPGRRRVDLESMPVATRLMSSRCLFIRAEKEQRSLTWSTLVRDYANSYGAHQSPSVYRYLFEARVYVTVGLPVVSFMLRRLGVAVSAACHELLTELQVDHEPPHHAAAVNGTDLGLATVRRNGDTDELLCLVRHDRDDISDVDVMSVPVSGDKEMVYRFPESGPPPVLIVRSPKSSP